ncbi:hypothetical protein DFH08DRAFT_1089910 [Mycena albidolilacea]|uniref:Uncharacterized protein n=1 Tax=Mycena albidolilacea TaxID=1033008 RepID=A0AAD7E7R6_9AGAR|nr:hypothetical protein DFH08DRAFT_1089910 [Mycena albidolilacea]
MTTVSTALSLSTFTSCASWNGGYETSSLALFHDVYRSFVSRFENNPGVSSAELSALLWQPGGFRFVIPCLRPYRVPSHFTFGAYSSPTLIADVLIPRQPTRTAFLFARSPSHSPSSCTPAPVLCPVRRSRWSATRAPPSPPPFLLHRAILSSSNQISQTRAVDHDERPHLPRFSVRASRRRRRRRPVAAAPTQEHELAFAATYLPVCNGYAGLIRVLLAISRVFSARMRGHVAFVLPSFTEPRLIAFLSIHQLTLNLSLPFLSVPFTHTSLGYSHSDKVGQINSLNGVLDYATGQCMLDYIPVIVEFIRSPTPTRRRNYLQPRNIIRGITGNGPFISIHDNFQGTASCTGFFPGSKRITLDAHPDFAFDGAPNDSPIATSTRRQLAIARRDHMERAGIKPFALVPMNMTRNWLFSMKKISPALGAVMRSALWSSQFRLQTGFLPIDPRDSVGVCAALGVVKDPSDDVFSARLIASGGEHREPDLTGVGGVHGDAGAAI